MNSDFHTGVEVTWVQWRSWPLHKYPPYAQRKLRERGIASVTIRTPATGPQRLYERRKILTSIYMPRISNSDTGDVRGLQRHTEAVADVKAAGARIDKSAAPK